MYKKIYEIRNATINDVPDISELSKQLGYPSLEHEIKERLESMLASNNQTIFVACQSGGQVIAWIHVYKRQSIESGLFAEIGGFIVSKAFQGKGIGNHLLKHIENWTIEKRLPKLRVRTQTKREDTQKFYAKAGFTVSKEQVAFDKMTDKKAQHSL